MKTLDACETGIFEISWSPDGKWITYIRNDNEVCLANVDTGEIRVVGSGATPAITADNTVILERDGEILLVSGSGTSTLVSRGAIAKNTPKRMPAVSPDGKRLVFVINNVFDKDSESKNAYPYRHFLGTMELPAGKPTITGEQWYGGTVRWFPEEAKFAHFEFDSTGGARVHVMDFTGESLGTMFGLYPSISPDQRHIACKPKSGGNVVVYSSKTGAWDKDSVETNVFKIPDSTGRLSGNPPQWLDNRFVIVDESSKLWKVDTRKEGATEVTKIPVPALRGKHTMRISPNRELLAIEVITPEGSFLGVTPIQ